MENLGRRTRSKLYEHLASQIDLTELIAAERGQTVETPQGSSERLTQTAWSAP